MAQSPLHPKLEHATDEFIGEILPEWLKRASVEQLQSLRSAYAAHLNSQASVAAAFDQVKALDEFARNLLANALYRDMALLVDLDSVQWREQRRRFRVEIGKLPTDEPYFVRVPALQKLMQNFASGESFYLETALVEPEVIDPPRAERVVTNDSEQIVTLCRATDVGARYQEHLDEVFDTAFEQTLATDLRLAFDLQVALADARRQVPAAELQVLRDIAKGQIPSYANCAQLRMLDCTLHGILVVDLTGAPAPLPAGHASGMLLLVPDDGEYPVRHFATWTAVNIFVVQMFKDPARRPAFEQRIALQDRPGMLPTLANRLADDEPDLDLALAAETGNLFTALATSRLERLRNDARLLAVPTAQADARQSSERLAALESAGLALLNLAGMFVPVVGSLLLANMVRQTLSEVYQGLRHWAQGHQHEALEHLLGVAENLAVNAAVAGGASVVAGAFTRSTFVDGLEPVLDDAGQQRLWSNDLAHYAEADLPGQFDTLDNGLLRAGSRTWWLRAGAYYRVRANTEQGPWRLMSPARDMEYGPELQWNGEQAWTLATERPLEWQGAPLLLQRLWPAAQAMDAEGVGQVLRVADVDEAHLRGLLVEQRPLPVELRDTLERFAVAARVERFLDGVAGEDDELFQWCLDELALRDQPELTPVATVVQQAARLRGRMFEAFASRYLGSDPQLAMLKRDFPGLPDAYALALLHDVTVEQRVAMRSAERIPLAVAQQARLRLQAARLTRLREGLYLRGSDREGLAEMVLALLARHAAWPVAEQLELREGTAAGRLLASMHATPAATAATTVMVRGADGYRLYGAGGDELPATLASALELPEAVLACLPEADRERLGWTGASAPQQLRTALQTWLPSDRAGLLELLGTRDAGLVHNPLQRLPDGRVGYVLSGRLPGTTVQHAILRARIRSLYPGFDEEEVTTFLNILLERPGSAYRNLLLQEQQYRRLNEALGLWASRGRSDASLANRRLAARELRRSWRLIGERIVDQHGDSQGMRLSLTGMPLRSLPDLPVGTDFSHVAELVLMDLALEQLPDGFLHGFGQLRWLNLSNNALTRVPTDLAQLSQLTYLRLANNQIQMSANGVTTLAALVRLQTLDLNFNPLGAISLQLLTLVRLRELNVRGTLLQTVPSGLHRCRLLEAADLRDNHIGALPQALLDAPLALRQAVELEGNPLSVTARQRMSGAAENAAEVLPAPVALTTARTQWLGLVSAAERATHEAQWDALNAEPGSGDFFQLLADLTGTRDFRTIPADLGRRVWAMLLAMHGATTLREELFTLAASPRTCVDSVASSFSMLEVRLYVTQALLEREPVAARTIRLRVARQLFRLDQVESIARADIQARLAEGRDSDEIEVSLAYRTGLASELDLPGQPRTMQFQTIAGVTQQQLTAAATTVRTAEASDLLARYVAQRDFWIQTLRDEQPTAFSEVEAPYWTRLDDLSEVSAGSEGAYLNQVNALVQERQDAVDALVLRLTRTALGSTGGSTEPAGDSV